MLVHVITPANKAHYSELMDEFFRIRHDIYVHEKQWREPSPDGMEFDQFDTDDATYLVGVVGNEIICGSRFITTDKPHLLADVFGALCTKEIVRSPSVAEWTRGFIVPKHRETGGVKVKAQSCAAVMDYCLRTGMSEVGGIQEVYWLPLWKRLGWDVRFVGEPTEIAGEICVPGFYKVTEKARDNARKWGGIEGTNLYWHGVDVPVAAE